MSNEIGSHTEKEQLNIIQKLVYGRLPLYIIYWGYGVGGGAVLALLVNFIVTDNKFLTELFLLITLLYQILINVGVWRAANDYKKSKPLAWIAKTLTSIGTLITIIVVFGYFDIENKKNNLKVTQKNHTPGQISNSKKNEIISNKKLGADWPWQKLYVKNGNWWVSMDERGRDKFNIVSAWLKTESISQAKKYGSSYNYTVLLMRFSCSDATYHIDSMTNVFYGELPDSDLMFEGLVDSEFKRIDAQETKEYVVKAYKRVCSNKN